jgi:hypothetical protein
MTLFYLLYLALLVAWVLLVWPALQTKGAVRIWLAVVILPGIAALVHEIWIFLYASDAIRIDILYISIVLLAFYGCTIVVLFMTKWRRSAALLGLVLLVIGAGMNFEWIKLQRETARLTDLFHERNALLFDAKFRDRQAYQSYFGPLEPVGGAFPAGHWQPEDGGYYKRLIINAKGDVWLFYACGETECALRNDEAGLKPVAGGAADTWQAELTPPAGVPVQVMIARQGPDRVSVAAGERMATFKTAPPPIGSEPAKQALTYLGTFAHAACRKRHSDVRQVWLWRQDDRLFALGIMSTLVAGRKSRFVEPLFLGEGERQGDAWSYTWERNGQDWRASIAPADGTVQLSLQRNDQDPVSTVLTGQTIVNDEVISLAPLTSVADWQHWFDVVLTGHFSTADVPECG